MNRHTTLRHATLAAALLALTACGSDKQKDEPATEKIMRPVGVRVLEYVPAPGQFINELPECTPSIANSFDPESAAQESLDAGEPVSLGALGGYITLQTALPITGRFRVTGNALSDSGEPGIVSVSADGKTWYDLKGEYYDRARPTVITYWQSDKDGVAAEYSIAGIGEGAIPFNQHHGQSYFPLWRDGSELKFSCLRLPDNGIFNQTSGQFNLEHYLGYADSWPNNSPNSILDIASTGNKDLKSVNLVRITSAILQVNGMLGECSTEVSGIEIEMNK